VRSAAAHVAPDIIATGRLRGERVDWAHLDVLAAMNRDARVMEWLGGPAAADETQEWLADKMADWRRHGYGLYALFERGAVCADDGRVAERAETGVRFVGRAGLQVAAGDVVAQLAGDGDPVALRGTIEQDAVQSSRAERQPVELLYALIPECWGRGLAAEIGRRLVEVAFADLDLAGLLAYTLPHNVRSRTVLERLGFRLVGDLLHEREPHVLYRLGRSG
jgi:ribosomal-protein-alanine N-acetyltransferase